MALNQLGLGMTFAAKDLASSVIQKLSGNYDGLGESAKVVKERLEEMGEAAIKAGATIAAFGAGGLVALGLAAGEAEAFENKIKLVAARVDEALFPMEQMEDLANGLAVQFGTLPAAQADAMFKAVEQGATSAAQAELLMTGANELAKSGAIELGAAISNVSEILKAWQLDFERSEDVAGALFVAAKAGKTSISELGGMLEHIAPAAARAGLSMEETLSAIAAMTSAGLAGRVALSGLRGVVDSLLSPSTAAKAQMAALGLKLDAATIQAKGLPTVLREIMTATKGSSAELEKLFGSAEAVTAVLAIMRNGGEQLTATLGQMEGGAKAVGDAAASLVQPAQQFQALKAQAITLIGQAILPIVNAVLNVMNIVLLAFTKLPKPVISAIVLTAAFGFGLLFLAGTAVATAGAFLAMDTAVGALVLTMAAATIAVAGIIAAMGLLVGGPIVAALVALKVAWDDNLGGMRDTLVAFWSKVKLVYDGITQLFTDGGFSGAVMAELDKAENSGLKQFAIEVFMWGSRIKAFFEAIGTAFHAVALKMAPVFAELVSAFTRLGNAFTALFGGPNNPEANAAKYDAFVEAGVRVAQVLGDITTAIIEGVTWVTNLVAAIGEWAATGDTVSGLGDAFENVVQGIGSVLSAAWDLGKALLSVSGDSEDAESVFGSLGRILYGVLGGALELVGGALKAIGGLIQMVAGLFSGDFTSAAVGAVNVVMGVLGGLAGALDRIVGIFGTHLGAEDFVAKLAAGARAAVTGVPEGTTLHTTAVHEIAGPGAGGADARDTSPAAAAAAVAVEQGRKQKDPSQEDHAVTQKLDQVVTAVRAQGAVPLNVYLDGEKIADGVAQRGAGGSARSFRPQPLPR